MNSELGIITIIDNNNCGNRLQNYAVQRILSKLSISNITIQNIAAFNDKKKCMYRKLRYFNRDFYYTYSTYLKRKNKFENFNDNINFTPKYTILSNYNFKFLLVGSDQVWNPNFGRLSDLDLLNVKCKNDTKKIAFSA